ncbi:MAG: S-layer homology domain-containing protein, partial [Clostridiales bacterium]|jgi:hypothetical protein|nr:S-layer homology domain-containing protein [Clostridiales bacterium]
LYRYAQYTRLAVSGGALTGFSDAGDVSDYARDALAWAVEVGLVQGHDGMLSPQDKATRAEFAAILHRFIEKAQ